MNNLEAALFYASERGWRVNYCAPGKKHPALKDWPSRGTTDETQIRAWFEGHPGRGVSLITGRTSGGLVILDVDVKGGAKGKESLANLQYQHGPLPPTYTVLTPSGGEHWYYRWDGEWLPKLNGGPLGPGLELFGDRADGEPGTQVMAPPTVIGGAAYRVGSYSDYVEDLPQWLADIALAAKHREVPPREEGPRQPYAEAPWGDGAWAGAIQHATRRILEAESGNRHHTFVAAATWIASRCKAGHGPWDPAANALAIAFRRAKPEAGDGEVRGVLDWAFMTADAQAAPPWGAEPIAAMKLQRNHSSLVEDACELVRRRHEKEERPLTTPWKALNHILDGGLFPGLYVDLGGTGTGKSQRSVQWCRHLLEQYDRATVAYLSFEMAPRDILVRLAADETGAPWSNLIRGEGTDAQAADITKAIRAFGDYGERLQIPDTPASGWTPEAIEAFVVALRDKRPDPLDSVVVVVDYLQIVDAPEDGGREPEMRSLIGGAVKRLRNLAKNLDVHVIAISSISRENQRMLAKDLRKVLEVPGETADKPPLALPDAVVGIGKETSSIEYFADALMVTVRVPSSAPGAMVTMVPKLRAGVPGWCVLRFSGTAYEDPSTSDVDAVHKWLSRHKKGSLRGAREEPGDDPYLELACQALKDGEMSHGDLADYVGLSRRALGRRLTEWLERGWVIKRTEWKWSLYSLPE